MHTFLALSGLAVSHAASIHPRLRSRQANTTGGGSVVWDGRISQTASVADFDLTTGAFKSDFTKGETVSFSDLILLPGGAPSLFDAQVGAQSLEVTINDKSIFRPGTQEPQSAIRRAELSPSSQLSANDITTTGVKTLHFSLMPDATRPLNVSHEYLLVFLETADFSANQFRVKTGTLIGSNGATKNDIVVLGNSAAGNDPLFTTPFTPDAFTNIALKMDFTANTIQIFQSTGDAALLQQTKPLPNDLSGNGELHFGVNKNPTDPGADSLRSGFQESGIDEGVIYGSIFVEDSADGVVSLE
ncbi:glycoside hydrolase family 131 protein [Melanomma pulvis-pyrius CBS 109.77]|uniref:Glycoside hydrolase family 131 protein n=1 Tax=Melanomma pulvis-pyrius CBS 109.77 TaxID=1314802 RepID=A0A6A6WVV8_9PLEO|nr:glycoside hydrolase family 131 protein [Melanomma pulvis-pyrius CBS 109.77]